MVPEWVKDSKLSDATPGDDVPNEAFAHDGLRLLPCHTKVATTISAGYYFSSPEQFPNSNYVRSRLLEKMALFGVEQPVQSETKSASTEPNWAYREGNRVAAPVDDQRSYNQAVDYLFQHRRQMSKHAAEAMTRRLVESDYFASASAENRRRLMKAARLGYGDRKAIKEALSMCGDEDLLNRVPELTKSAKLLTGPQLVVLDRLLTERHSSLPDHLVTYTLDDVAAAKEAQKKSARITDPNQLVLLHGDLAMDVMLDSL